MAKKQNQINIYCCAYLILRYGIHCKWYMFVRVCLYLGVLATSSGLIVVTHVLISLQHALSLILRLALQTVAGVRPLHKATQHDVTDAETKDQQTSICTDAILSVPVGGSD